MGNERAVPDRLSALLLRLAAGALASHSRSTVLRALREAGPDPDALLLALTWLRRNPGDRKGTGGTVRLPHTLLTRAAFFLGSSKFELTSALTLLRTVRTASPFGRNPLSSGLV